MRKVIKRMTFRPSKDVADLFHHTSGRWLWNEDEQMRLRYRQFDILSLQQAVSRAMGDIKCGSLIKIGEGNYNKAYSLATETGQRVIAKIPHPNAGPPRFTTASEVATMDFARNVLGLPVPKVLAWNANADNPVGAEYIIMEEARGSPLHEAWKTLTLRAKCGILDRVVEVERKLLSISFEKIGSMYFSDNHIPGRAPLAATIDKQDISNDIRSKFCVGPIVRREFWEKERQHMKQYHGPWNTPAEYLGSIARRETEWIKNYADPSAGPFHPYTFTSQNQRSRDAHIALLRKFLAVVPAVVPEDPQIASPSLWHPDFHPGNIFIDEEGQISSIIDWQGSWLTPVFIGATPPQLLDYGVDVLMKLPSDFKQLDEATQSRLRTQVSESILLATYETSASVRNPRMHKMMHYNHGQTLRQLEAFVGTTWEDSIFPLQDCLIRVEREWDHFDTHMPCPIRFSEEEIESHDEDVESFNKHQEFWQALRGIVTDDGYVSQDKYTEATEMFKGLHESDSLQLTKIASKPQ